MTANSNDHLTEDEVRSLLETVRHENESDLRSARETLNQLTEDGSASSATVTDLVASASHMVGDAERILAEVRSAEERLADGTYGICTSCGNPIGDGRLRLRPYVSTCVGCAAA